MMKPTRVFIHGLESSSKGTKGSFFLKRYPDMVIEDFLGSFPGRMKKLESLLDGKSGLVLVGSSYGGLMAAVYACLHEDRVGKLVLLAPALHLEPSVPYLDKELRIPVVIYQGLRDNVVPLEAVRTVAQRLFKNLTFNVVDDDHNLHNIFPTLDWDALLSLQNPELRIF